MFDLEEKSGLPLLLDDEIVKGKSGFDLPKPDFRRLEEMMFVLKQGSELIGPEIVYMMFRNVTKEEDKDLFQKSGLEYDITVIPAGPLGDEYTKTYGHYHSIKEGTDVSYPEIYEVIYGKAHYVLQKVENGQVTDVKILEAEAGDKVIVPPGYGHITINPTDDTLVESNIQPLANKSSYDDFTRKHGADFYETDEGKWVKNENYDDDFEPKFISASEAKDVFNVSLKNSTPLYLDFIWGPEKYDFLTSPEKYLDKFSQIYS